MHKYRSYLPHFIGRLMNVLAIKKELARDKHSSLFGHFVSLTKKNIVFCVVHTWVSALSRKILRCLALVGVSLFGSRTFEADFFISSVFLDGCLLLNMVVD
jgi:hypothetical protein